MRCSTRMPMMSSWGYPNSAETWRLANRMTPEASMMIIASGAASSALRANSGGADCMEGGTGAGYWLVCVSGSLTLWRASRAPQKTVQFARGHDTSKKRGGIEQRKQKHVLQSTNKRTQNV